jgi:hypothetical protein
MPAVLGFRVNWRRLREVLECQAAEHWSERLGG